MPEKAALDDSTILPRFLTERKQSGSAAVTKGYLFIVWRAHDPVFPPVLHIAVSVCVRHTCDRATDTLRRKIKMASIRFFMDPLTEV